MTEHILKTTDVYWDAIERGEKNFEVRRDDRGFQKGDVLILRRVEFSTFSADKKIIESRCPHRNTPRDLRRKVTYILTGGQLGVEPGYVVMGLKKA